MVVRFKHLCSYTQRCRTKFVTSGTLAYPSESLIIPILCGIIKIIKGNDDGNMYTLNLKPQILIIPNYIIPRVVFLEKEFSMILMITKQQKPHICINGLPSGYAGSIYQNYKFSEYILYYKTTLEGIAF